MTATTTSPGDVVRAAAESLAARYPSLPRPVLDHLRDLARRHDADTAVTAARAALARQRRLDRLDTRGRWARRTVGNGGPGRPGLGHVAEPGRRHHLRDAVAVCGAQLRGEVEWATPARRDKTPPTGWRACARCLDLLPDVWRTAA